MQALDTSASELILSLDQFLLSLAVVFLLIKLFLPELNYFESYNRQPKEAVIKGFFGYSLSQKTEDSA